MRNMLLHVYSLRPDLYKKTSKDASSVSLTKEQVSEGLSRKGVGGGG